MKWSKNNKALAVALFTACLAVLAPHVSLSQHEISHIFDALIGFGGA